MKTRFRFPEWSLTLPSSPLGEILVGLGLVTDEECESALRAQGVGATALRDILHEAGITDVEQVEDALVEGTSTGTLIREHLVNMDLVEDERLADAILAKRNSGQRLGELLGLDSRELAKALHHQRQARRESPHGRLVAWCRGVEHRRRHICTGGGKDPRSNHGRVGRASG